MSTPIPPPLRAAAGLAAVAIDSARKLPEQLVGLPVLAVSAALQVSLKAQQRYARLVARGDEVLGQLRGVEDAPPWAQFDEPGAAARPRSAFDAAPDPEPGPLDGDLLLDELAADQLGGGEAEADLLAEAGLDAGGVVDGFGDGTRLEDGIVLEPDGVAATEAEAGGLDVAEVPLAGTGPGVDLPAGEITGGEPAGGPLADPAAAEPPGVDPTAERRNGRARGSRGGRLGADPDQAREPGSGTEPGVDLPAGGVTGLAADAEAVEDALTAPETAPAETVIPEADPAAGLDGYLAVEPPIARYDELSIPQLRGRLRSLSAEQVEALVAYERATAGRPPYLTMLENRLVTLRSR